MSYADPSKMIWPPRLVVGNRTVYLITVDLSPPEESASRRGALTPIVLTREELLPSS